MPKECVVIPVCIFSNFSKNKDTWNSECLFRSSNAYGGFQLSSNHIMWWLEFQVLCRNLLPGKLWAASSWHHISVICICWSPGTWGVNDEIFMLVTIQFPSTKSLCYHPLERELGNLPAAKYACAFVKKIPDRVHKIRFPVWIRCLELILDEALGGFSITLLVFSNDTPTTASTPPPQPAEDIVDFLFLELPYGWLETCPCLSG